MSVDSNNRNALIAEIAAKFSSQLTQPWLLVDTAEQRLRVVDRDRERCHYRISTSKLGNGCRQDSLQTPTGAHSIAQKIGQSEPIGEIFVGRQPTGQIAQINHASEATGQDLILSRILWLKGLEKNKNSGDGCDSYQRYIYIHGTHEEGLLGTPASHGCVRMSNADVIELYECVDEGAFVYIQ